MKDSEPRIKANDPGGERHLGLEESVTEVEERLGGGRREPRPSGQRGGPAPDRQPVGRDAVDVAPREPDRDQ
jgi:hypothetical protein